MGVIYMYNPNSSQPSDVATRVPAMNFISQLLNLSALLLFLFRSLGEFFFYPTQVLGWVIIIFWACDADSRRPRCRKCQVRQ